MWSLYIHKAAAVAAKKSLQAWEGSGRDCGLRLPGPAARRGRNEAAF